MNRCPNDSPIRGWTRWTMGLLGALLAVSALAQEGFRQFPRHALRGELVLMVSPEVMLDGKRDRLSPGARIRNPDNLIVMPGLLRGQTLVVNYVRELNGMIHEVWILTPAEAEQKRASAGSGRNFSFGYESTAPAPSTPPSNSP